MRRRPSLSLLLVGVFTAGCTTSKKIDILDSILDSLGFGSEVGSEAPPRQPDLVPASLQSCRVIVGVRTVELGCPYARFRATALFSSASPPEAVAKHAGENCQFISRILPYGEVFSTTPGNSTECPGPGCCNLRVVAAQFSGPPPGEVVCESAAEGAAACDAFVRGMLTSPQGFVRRLQAAIPAFERAE